MRIVEVNCNKVVLRIDLDMFNQQIIHLAEAINLVHDPVQEKNLEGLLGLCCELYHAILPDPPDCYYTTAEEIVQAYYSGELAENYPLLFKTMNIILSETHKDESNH